MTMKPNHLFRLSLLSLALGLAGCQTFTPEKASSDSAKISSSDDIITAKDSALIPDSIELDQAEARFERDIIQAEGHALAKPTSQQKPSEPREEAWDELADRFYLIEPYKEKYQNYLTFYLNNPRHLERSSTRAKPYLHFILDEIRRRDMPYEIALLPIVESAFYPYARSHMQAVGLWQFIPSTGRIYGLNQNWWFDGRQDVYMSTHAALDFLQSLHQLNNGDWFLALASYNAGYGRIQQATARLKRADPNAEVNYWTIRPYLPRETRHYVPQLLAVSYLIKHREQYELAIESIPNTPYLTRVDNNRQIDINRVADSIGLSHELMKHLNPGYLKSITPPNGPHHIMVPISHQAKLEQQLASNQDLFNIRWHQHQIVRGDTLGGIAQRYRTSVAEIRRLNNLRGNIIREGRTLMIPVPAQGRTQLAATNTAATRTGTNASTGSSQPLIHHVQRGESLSVIAQQYQVRTTDLASWNNLTTRSVLQIGQALEIRSPQLGHSMQHTVRNGESLWLIARRYQVAVNDISRWNNLNPNTILRPGTNLTIWLPGQSNEYTVQRGDTLWDIAKTFNVNQNRLLEYNKLSRNQYLMPGQVLRIPNDG